MLVRVHRRERIKRKKVSKAFEISVSVNSTYDQSLLETLCQRKDVQMNGNLLFGQVFLGRGKVIHCIFRWSRLLFWYCALSWHMILM